MITANLVVTAMAKRWRRRGRSAAVTRATVPAGIAEYIAHQHPDDAIAGPFEQLLAGAFRRVTRLDPGRT